MKLNWPNRLVIIRIVLALAVIGLLIAIPYATADVFYTTWGACDPVREVHYFNYIALGLFALASATDWLDGYLARKNNQVTDFGKLFDPIADKILVNSVLIILAIQSRMPAWVPVLFIIRDLFVEGLRMNLASKGQVLPADKYGKLKTVLQMLGLMVLFIIFPEPSATGAFDYSSMYHIAVIPLYLALIASLFSGYNYFKGSIKEVLNV